MNSKIGCTCGLRDAHSLGEARSWGTALVAFLLSTLTKFVCAIAAIKIKQLVEVVMGKLQTELFRSMLNLFSAFWVVSTLPA